MHIIAYLCSNHRQFRATIRKENDMKKKKQKVAKTTMMDAIKAMRRGNREAEQELLGPGFHSFNRLHKSKKTYTRKAKHKKNEE